VRQIGTASTYSRQWATRWGPAWYDLVIDLRVAREQGIKVPQGLLFRADEVIH
jgi:hypothetical protein